MNATQLREIARQLTAAAHTANQAAETIDALTGLLAQRDTELADLRARLAKHEQPILWGSNVWRFGGETYRQALARTEKALGQLDIVRYFCPGAPFWPLETGDRPLHISFKWRPQDVIAGKHDAALRAWCAQAPDRPTWWTYFHEPEDDVARGSFTAAQYREAWRRLANIAFASRKDLRPTLCLMSWTLRTPGRWLDFYPGADHVDVLSWDAYHGLSGETDPAKVYAECRRISAQIGKPWAIAETGVRRGIESREAILGSLAKDLSTVEPRPVFVTYFDTHNPAEGDGTMAWDISRDPESAAAWLAGWPELN